MDGKLPDHSFPGASQIARFAGRVALWLLRRPFLAAPWAWVAAAGALIALAVVAELADAFWPYMTLGLAALAAISIAVAVRWVTWRERSERPLIVIARFKAHTPGGRELAITHARALRRHLLDDPHLDPVSVRIIDVPVSPSGAARILRYLGARMVVHGEVDRAGDVSHWECELTVPGAPEVSLATRTFSTRTHRRSASRRMARLIGLAAARQRRIREGSVPIEELVAQEVKVSHFRGVAATALLLQAEDEFGLAQQTGDAIEQLRLPDLQTAGLPPELAARVVELEAEAQRGTMPPQDLIAHVANEVEAGFGGAPLWTFLAHQCFIGVNEDWATPAQVVEYARRAAEAAADDPARWLDLANGQVMTGQLDDATESLHRAEAVGADEQTLTWQQGIITFNRAVRDAPQSVDLDGVKDALALWKRAHRRRRRNLMAQMGHCEAILAHEGQGKGHSRRARRYLRRALRLDPFLQQELTRLQYLSDIEAPLPLGRGEGWGGGAWRMLNLPGRTGRFLRPISRGLLRLQLWTRPEHPWARAWLGRAHLLALDLKQADLWLEFATDIPGANRIQPVLDEALVCALTNDEANARAFYDSVPTHTAWLAQHDCAVDESTIEELARQPFRLDPRLPGLAGAARARALAKATLKLELG